MPRLTVISALVAVSLSCASAPPAPREAQCDSSPLTLRLKCIAPAIGAEPVWVTGGGCWCGERPVKAAWIIDSKYGGTLEVHGSGINVDAPVYFPRIRGDRNGSFVVQSANQSSVMPGGIDRDEQERYAFHMGYVSYPQPGCYRLVATLGDRVVSIVVDQPRCPDCKLATALPQQP